MAMTKKDFIALADALRGTLVQPVRKFDEPSKLEHDVEVEPLIRALCAFMRSQNPRFMESRWRDYLAGACGPCGGKVKK